MDCKTFRNLDMDVQNKILDAAQATILALPGATTVRTSYMLVDFTGSYDRTIFLKFCSEHGITDDLNGLALQKYLQEQGIAFESDRSRSLIMSTDDFLRLFGPTE